MDYLQLYTDFKEQTISGRYLHLDHIEPLLLSNKKQNYVTIIGRSIQNKPIYKYQFGTGKIKLLMWSQMHGNESTTTKALFDLFNLLESDLDLVSSFFSKFTLCVIPILNPDGAKLYTRENANGLDLNRDAQDLSQPESIVLRNLYLEFKPDYCFNLHDQRSIYGVGNSNLPATVSLLAPAFDYLNSISESRLKAYSVIVHINEVLQQYIPGQVGRYDDSFNPNCVGDTFQGFGTPTILFEAGHFSNDYNREETRKFIFIALLNALFVINDNEVNESSVDKYSNIPLNNTLFLDIIYKNVQINYDNTIKTINFAAQYEETLVNNTIEFISIVSKINELDNFLGHLEFDLKNELYQDNFMNYPVINQKNDFYLKNGTKFVNGLLIK